jgi:hypothetical protein
MTGAPTSRPRHRTRRDETSTSGAAGDPRRHARPVQLRGRRGDLQLRRVPRHLQRPWRSAPIRLRKAVRDRLQRLTQLRTRPPPNNSNRVELSCDSRLKPGRTRHEITSSSCHRHSPQQRRPRRWDGPAFGLPLVQEGRMRCRGDRLWRRMRGKLGHRVSAVHRSYDRRLWRLRIGRIYQMSPAGGDSVPQGATNIVADDPASAHRRRET